MSGFYCEPWTWNRDVRQRVLRANWDQVSPLCFHHFWVSDKNVVVGQEWRIYSVRESKEQELQASRGGLNTRRSTYTVYRRMWGRHITYKKRTLILVTIQNVPIPARCNILPNSLRRYWHPEACNRLYLCHIKITIVKAKLAACKCRPFNLISKKPKRRSDYSCLTLDEVKNTRTDKTAAAVGNWYSIFFFDFRKTLSEERVSNFKLYSDEIWMAVVWLWVIVRRY